MCVPRVQWPAPPQAGGRSDDDGDPPEICLSQMETNGWKIMIIAVLMKVWVLSLVKKFRIRSSNSRCGVDDSGPVVGGYFW